MQIGLFVTCVNNVLYPATGRAVVRLLERLGHTVTFPEPQTCCGQMHLNGGYRPEGLALARASIDVLSLSETDAIVVPSASCTATIRSSWADAAADEGDRSLAADVASLAPRVYELTELLVDVLGVTDVGAHFPHRVAYHPTCHSLRGLHLGDRPVKLLREVRDLQLVPILAEDSCCGFGGLFAVKNPETSTAMGDDKLAAVAETRAEVLCATDNSCLAHLGGLVRAGHGPGSLRVMHLAEILAGEPR